MTAQEIYDTALAVVSQLEGENSRWDKMAVSWVNLVLSNSIEAENGWRHYMGEKPLKHAPRIVSLEDETQFHDRLFGSLVEQVAAYLWTDADEGYKAQDCRNRAAENLNEIMRYSQPQQIEDVYKTWQ